MAAARAERAQTKNWIMGIHPVSADAANSFNDEGVALSELAGIDLSDIGIICSATRKPRGTVSTDARGTYPMPQIHNPGMNVPDILQLKMSVSVTTALYHEEIGRPIIPSIMNWARI